MKPAIALTFVAVVLATGPSEAQQQPYAGLQSRPVKSLSDQQMADLRAGRGMGLALAAELNGYPGPAHVLELSDKLHLSDLQRVRVAELFAAMKAETIPIGERVIAQEQDLERLFATKAVTPASLEAAVISIAATQGALRAAHLRYHLTILAELTPEQVKRYSELRGYAADTKLQHGTGHGRGAH
jgi:hypothetical protein